MNRVFKALADPTRRRVLELLRAQPMTAGALCDHFPVSKPTMSAHFAVLREADLVDSRKQGTTITYRLKLSVLEEALLGFSQTFGIGSGAPAADAEVDPDTPAPTGPAEGRAP
ncbi:MAG: autorepressor SdpR family transcription factor [Brevundimonas sp.]|jgi:DNA-binding transcriptional ArsR family regulator